MLENLKEYMRISVDPEFARIQAEGTSSAIEGSSLNPSHRIFTLANVLTFARFIMTTVFLFIFVLRPERELAVTLYAIAALTDFLDGYIARSTNTVSWLGKIMDPIIDRYLLLTGVLGLVLRNEIPVWIAVVAIARDVYLFFGSVFLKRYQKNPIDVIFIGKAATAVLMTGFAIMMIGSPSIEGLNVVESPFLPGLGKASDKLGLLVIYLGVFLSFISAAVYTVRGIRIIRSVKSQTQEDAK